MFWSDSEWRLFIVVIIAIGVIGGAALVGTAWAISSWVFG